MANKIIKDEHGCEFLFRFCKGISANFSVRVIDEELAIVI